MKLYISWLNSDKVPDALAALMVLAPILTVILLLMVCISILAK